MTKDLNDEIDGILDRITPVIWDTASYPLIPPKEKARVKTEIHRLITEARITELKKLSAAMKGRWHKNPQEVRNAMNKQIDTRIKTLKALLGDG